MRAWRTGRPAQRPQVPPDSREHGARPRQVHDDAPGTSNTPHFLSSHPKHGSETAPVCRHCRDRKQTQDWKRPGLPQTKQDAVAGPLHARVALGLRSCQSPVRGAFPCYANSVPTFQMHRIKITSYFAIYSNFKIQKKLQTPNGPLLGVLTP